MTSSVPALLTLAEVLREFRVRRKLSKRALSKEAGLSSSYIGKLEAGVIDPSMRAFAQIALALELNSHEILFCIGCVLSQLRQGDTENLPEPIDQ